MADPIGISFLPSTQNQAMGPQQGQMEGDLASAFKILSLRLPRVLGAQAIAPSSLLNSQGSGGVMGGFNPYSAVFDALLKAAGLSGGAPGMPGSMGMSGGVSPLPGGTRFGAGNAGRLPQPPPAGGTRIGVPTPVGPRQPGIGDQPPPTPSPVSSPRAPTSPWDYSAPVDPRWNRGGDY